MITFHGWLQIDTEEIDTSSREALRQREDRCNTIIERIADVADPFSTVALEDGGNGMSVLIAHGIRNNESEHIIELFKWAADTHPESFGLLHVWNSEHDNHFTVFRFAHGKCIEMTDPHLSPCIPTIEKPHKS